jgi:RNA polymerase sigma-70 factor (sigma-E family)
MQRRRDAEHLYGMGLVESGEVGAIRESSKASVEELYRVHAPEARRLAYLLTGDRELAEDVTQDAFIRVVGRLAHLRSRNAFGPYLRRAVINLTRMHFRRRTVEKRQTARDSHSHAGSSAWVEDVAELETLRTALLELPYRQRAAIVLRFYTDLPDEETAAILDCAVGTVRSLISRGMAELREAMGSDDRG